jgi:hypothetical protein
MSNYFDTLLSTVGLAAPVQPAPLTASPIASPLPESSGFAEISTETIAPPPSVSASAPQPFAPMAQAPAPASPQPIAPGPRPAQHAPSVSTASALPLPGELTQNPDSAALLQQVLAWLGREPEATAPAAPIMAAPTTITEESTTKPAPLVASTLTATRSLRPADTRETTAPATTAQTTEAPAPAARPPSESTRISASTVTDQSSDNRAVMPPVQIISATPVEPTATTVVPASPRPSFVPSIPSAPPAPPPAIPAESSLNVSIGSIHVKIEGPASAPVQTTIRPAAAPRPSRQASTASTRAHRSNRLSRHAL